VGSPLVDTWLYTTLLIENQWGELGTGFLISRLIDKDIGKFFLATNKHVLNKDPELRESSTHVFLHFNIRNSDGSIRKQRIAWPIISSDGSKLWRSHPDQDVDVLVFDVTSFINFRKDIVAKWVNYSLFCDRSIIEEKDITIGDEVIVVGYPLGFRHRTTNFPLFRSGMISTCIGEELEDIIRENGVERRRTLRGFLIDGGIVPGSSGSPVVLKPTIGHINRKAKTIMMGTLPPYLLGIVAETRYAPILTDKEEAIPSFAGLGLAFDAVTIMETIEIFFTS